MHALTGGFGAVASGGCVVPPRGFEPPTNGLGNRCSILTELRGHSRVSYYTTSAVLIAASGSRCPVRTPASPPPALTANLCLPRIRGPTQRLSKPETARKTRRIACRRRCRGTGRGVCDMARRAFIIVLDSVGIGEMPDAHLFGDDGSDTLGNLSRVFDDGLKPADYGRDGAGQHRGSAWRARSRCAPGGIRQVRGEVARQGYDARALGDRGFGLRTRLPHLPRRFSAGGHARLRAGIGTATLGNIPASGTDIIRQLGEEHVRTGKPIVYTSGDSVFQIAATRRSSARSACTRCARRHGASLTAPPRGARDRAAVHRRGRGLRTHTQPPRFSVPPPAATLLDRVKEAGLASIGVGKIGDIFSHQGLTPRSTRRTTRTARWRRCFRSTKRPTAWFSPTWWTRT